jgi:hypothetical protein
MPVRVSHRLQCLHSSTALRIAARKDLGDNCRFCVSSGYQHPCQTRVNRVSHRLRYLESGTVPMAPMRKKWETTADSSSARLYLIGHSTFMIPQRRRQHLPKKLQSLADLTSTPYSLTGTTILSAPQSCRCLLTNHKKGLSSNQVIIQIMSVPNLLPPTV